MDIAILDNDGILKAVTSVQESEWKTDPLTKRVKLEHGHDMHNRLGQYRFDFNAGFFMPLVDDPVDLALDTPDLMEGIISFMEEVDSKGVVKIPLKTRQAIREYRKTFDGRKRR